MEKPTVQTRRCKAPGCDATNRTERLFRSPDDPHRSKMWSEAVGLVQVDTLRTFYLCGRHFSQKCFYRAHQRDKLTRFANPCFRTGVLNSVTGNYCPSKPQCSKMESPVKCSAPGCDVSSRTHPETLFEFPSNKERMAIWLEFLGIHDSNPDENIYLCSRHFSSSDFVNLLRQELLPYTNPSYVTGPLNPLSGDYCPVEPPVTTTPVDLLGSPQQLDLPSFSSTRSTNEIMEKGYMNRNICQIRGCAPAHFPQPDITYHCAPTDCSKRAEEWRVTLGLGPEIHNYVVCNRHFGAHQYPDGNPKRSTLDRYENPLYRYGQLNPIFCDYSPFTPEQSALYGEFILGRTIDWAYMETKFRGKVDLDEIRVLIKYMAALADKTDRTNVVAEIPSEYWNAKPPEFRKCSTKLHSVHDVYACDYCSTKLHSANELPLKNVNNPVEGSDPGSVDEVESSNYIENDSLAGDDETERDGSYNLSLDTHGNVIATDAEFNQIPSMLLLVANDHSAVLQNQASLHVNKVEDHALTNRVLIMTKQNGKDWTMGETREASSFLITQLLRLSVNYKKYRDKNGLGCSSFQSSSLIGPKLFMILCSDANTAKTILEELSDTINKEGWCIDCWPDIRKPVISTFIPGCIISKDYAMKMMEFFNKGKGLHVSAWKMQTWEETQNGVRMKVEVPCEDGFIVQKLGMLCFELRLIKFEVSWPQEINKLMSSVNGENECLEREMPKDSPKPVSTNVLKGSTAWSKQFQINSQKNTTWSKLLLINQQKAVLPVKHGIEKQTPVDKNIPVAASRTHSHSSKRSVRANDCLEEAQKENVVCSKTSEICESVKQSLGSSYMKAIPEKVHIDKESSEGMKAMEEGHDKMRASKKRIASPRKLNSCNESTFRTDKSSNIDTSSNKPVPIYKKRRCKEMKEEVNSAVRTRSYE